MAVPSWDEAHWLSSIGAQMWDIDGVTPFTVDNAGSPYYGDFGYQPAGAWAIGFRPGIVTLMLTAPNGVYDPWSERLFSIQQAIGDAVSYSLVDVSYPYVMDFTGITSDITGMYIRDVHGDGHPVTVTSIVFTEVGGAAKLLGWGANDYGTIGEGTTTDVLVPTVIDTSTWLLVDSSNAHTHGIKSDGTLWGWGYNGYNNIGLGSSSPTSILTPTQVGSATSWVHVSTGFAVTHAVQSDGTLWGWGYVFNTTMGDGSSSHSSPTQIGSITTWVKTSHGPNHVHAIRSDGTLWAWGANYAGQLGDGSTIARQTPVQVGSATWSQVVSGEAHTHAIKSDGTLWGWGDNTNGILGDGNTAQRNSPVQIGLANDWVRLSKKSSSTLALKLDGTLWAWGTNTYGQLGFEITTTYVTTPTQVGTNHWLEIHSGNSYSLGIKSDFTLVAVGSNLNGELGNGTTSEYTTPVSLGKVSNYTFPALFGGLNSSFLIGTITPQKLLIIEDSNGLVLHSRDIADYLAGRHSLLYDLDASTWEGKLKIYTTGMFPNLVKLIDIKCLEKPCDPYWDNVVLAMHMDGENNGTTFTDEKGHILTRSDSGVFVSTTESKFGGSSVRFNGASYLNLPAADLSLVTGNWKVSVFVRLDFVGNIHYILGRWNAPGSRGMVLGIDNDDKPFMTISSNGTAYFSVDSPIAIPEEQWVFLTYSRVGDVYSIKADCVELVSVTQAGSIYLPADHDWRIGTFNNPTTDNYFEGYMDELRIQTGSGVTATCTIPTAPFADVVCEVPAPWDPYWDQVVLLLDGVNFTDKSSYNTTITNANITTSDGMYQCNGTGQLTTTSNATELDWASQDFTVEIFIQRNAAGYGAIMGTNATGIILSMSVYGPLRLYLNNTLVFTVPVPTPDVLHHLAITHRISDGRVQYYVDGELITTATWTGSIIPNNFGILGETYYNSPPQLGYGGLVQVSGVRFTKAIRYEGDFSDSLPTAPFPDVAPEVPVTPPVLAPINIKYRELYWSIIKEPMFKFQNLNWSIGARTYGKVIDLKWSTYPVKLLAQELNWATRPQIVKNTDIYYSISSIVYQDLKWSISPIIVQDLSWSIGIQINKSLNWSIANIRSQQIAWLINNNSIVSDLNWSIRQWNTQEISWEVE